MLQPLAISNCEISDHGGCQCCRDPISSTGATTMELEAAKALKAAAFGGPFELWLTSLKVVCLSTQRDQASIKEAGS
jgi:hypothetical protein